MIKQRWVIICAVTGVIVLIYLLIFFLPALKGLNGVKAEVAMNVSKEGNAGEQIVAASNLAHAIETAHGQLSIQEMRIPDSTSKLEIIHAIEKISRDSKKLNEVSLRVLGSSKLLNDGIEKQLFEVGFEGTYEEIAVFLRRATHLPYLITVEDLLVAVNVKGKLTAKAVMGCYLATGMDVPIKTEMSAE